MFSFLSEGDCDHDPRIHSDCDLENGNEKSEFENSEFDGDDDNDDDDGPS